MSEIDDLGIARHDGPRVPEGDPGWQPLPRRARPLFIASGLMGMLVPALLVTGLGGWLATRLDLAVWMAIVTACALLLFGAWLGNKKYRYTHWLLDAHGFALRRGRLWRSETRVPGSRVQHIDIRRGPIERRVRLSTLVIHTAGTRHHAVSVSGLDADDAERLRDHLALGVEHDDDDA